MKKEYNKPVIEIVELRPEEHIGLNCTIRIATLSWNSNSNKYNGQCTGANNQS